MSSPPDTPRTTSWTACFKQMLRGHAKKDNMENYDNGRTSTSQYIQGDMNEKNKCPNVYIKKIGTWGGVSGNYKDIEVAPLCLKNITIESGQYINVLKFSYNDEYGMKHHVGPWGLVDKYLPHRLINKIQLGPKEYLTGISGTIDTSNMYSTTIISSLTFITNTSQYGPFGSVGQISFHSPPISNNSCIVGFFCRCGTVLDAIGIYVKLEREPTMEKKGLITKVGPWGGHMGYDHDVFVIPRRLISMIVCSGEVIDSLTFIYNDCDGLQHTAGPWGGLSVSKKGAFHTIMLGHLEIVTKVSGTIGLNTITSLTFVTNIATYGPFGDGGGMTFHIPTQNNGSIVGFFANADKHIHSIGFYLTSVEKQDKDGDIGTNPRLQDDIKKLDKTSLTKIGLWGGYKGNRKDIEVAPLCLNSLTIRSGEVVFSLAFSYNDEDGKQHHAGPWGGSEGFSTGSFDTIQLEPLEFLIEVSGTIGPSSKYSSNVLGEVYGTTDFCSEYSHNVVTSIMFITTNDRRYGPYGEGGGVPFHSPVLSSGSIVGFFAHAERVIDAVGLYMTPQKEPTKEKDSVIKIGPWGGASGRPNDVDVLPRRLISILVHSGEVINSLTYTYIDCAGQEHTAGPWGSIGGPLDGSSHTILLGQSDFLLHVSGTIGHSSKHSDVVTSLFFVTNTGSYGPYGKEGGTVFRSPSKIDGSIVGFFVNAKDVVDAIGVYFFPRMETVTRVDIQSASSVLEHIILDRSMEPENVPLALLQHITEDFSEEREIGRGGFGVVYKGDFQNVNVAVKRLFNGFTIDEELFYREATNLIGIKHENIVRFLGYCANTESKAMMHSNPGETTKHIFAEIRERLLCFEYIMNGSLDKYITDELRGLEWHTRYSIIKGICSGLDYLHNEKDIVHRDMKPANILVDDLMVPKITDFGISKLLCGATHAVTSTSAMTFGYSAPELIHHGVVSFKSDMYSLGVIIMELVTGSKGGHYKNVLRRWRHRWNKSKKYPPLGYQQVTKCIEIASMCLSHSPYKRPHVREILSMLNATENIDVQMNSAGDSSLCPISPYPWELLEFDKLELNLPFEINKQIACSLELTNVTDDYTAFDIQKTGMLEYLIEPNKGVVPARAKCIVIVILKSRMAAPYDMMCKDEFVVRCTAVNEGFTAENIHEDMFNNDSGKLVDEVTLKVII